MACHGGGGEIGVTPLVLSSDIIGDFTWVGGVLCNCLAYLQFATKQSN